MTDTPPTEWVRVLFGAKKLMWVGLPAVQGCASGSTQIFVWRPLPPE